MMASALIKSTPTKLIPIAMVTAIRARSINSVKSDDLSAAALRSGAIEKRVNRFKYFSTKNITPKATMP